MLCTITALLLPHRLICQAVAAWMDRMSPLHQAFKTLLQHDLTSENMIIATDVAFGILQSGQHKD